MNFERCVGIASAVGLVLILLLITWLGLWGPAGHELTGANVGEFIKVLGSIATGAAALTGAIIAWRGLRSGGANHGHEAFGVGCNRPRRVLRNGRNYPIVTQPLGHGA